MEVQRRDGILLKNALDKSLDILGGSSKEAVPYQLAFRYRISFDDGLCSIKEIELALTEILGQGASLIIQRLRSEQKDALVRDEVYTGGR